MLSCGITVQFVIVIILFSLSDIMHFCCSADLMILYVHVMLCYDRLCQKFMLVAIAIDNKITISFLKSCIGVLFLLDS